MYRYWLVCLFSLYSLQVEAGCTRILGGAPVYVDSFGNTVIFNLIQEEKSYCGTGAPYGYANVRSYLKFWRIIPTLTTIDMTGLIIKTEYLSADTFKNIQFVLPVPNDSICVLVTRQCHRFLCDSVFLSVEDQHFFKEIYLSEQSKLPEGFGSTTGNSEFILRTFSFNNSDCLNPRQASKVPKYKFYYSSKSGIQFICMLYPDAFERKTETANNVTTHFRFLFRQL